MFVIYRYVGIKSRCDVYTEHQKLYYQKDGGRLYLHFLLFDLFFLDSFWYGITTEKQAKLKHEFVILNLYRTRAYYSYNQASTTFDMTFTTSSIGE